MHAHVVQIYIYAYKAYVKSLISNLEIKSLAVSDMLSKISSSKSYSAFVTFPIVSKSESPMKGDKPDNL